MKYIILLILTACNMFVPSPKQSEALALMKSEAVHVMLYGGRRSGKTAIICEAFVHKAIKYPGSRYLGARLRYSHARTSLMHETLAPIMDRLPAGTVRENKVDCLYEFNNGSEYWIGGFDDEKRAEKILGHEYAGVHFNECSQIGYNTILLGNTCLAQNIPGCRNTASYDENPPSPLHWSYSLFILKKDPKTNQPLIKPELYTSLLMNPIDNLKNLPKNYISDFLDTLPEKERMRFRDGKFVKESGLVYDEFDESLIIPASAVPQIESYIVGVDFGLNSVAVLIGQAGETQYILDEIILYNKPASLLNAKMRDNWGHLSYIAYCDPSGGERIQEIDFGVKANNSVEPGIDCIRMLMHTGNLFVVETCRGVIDGFVIYRRDDKERIIKEDDHEMDAVRYGIFTDKNRQSWGLA